MWTCFYARYGRIRVVFSLCRGSNTMWGSSRYGTTCGNGGCSLACSINPTWCVKYKSIGLVGGLWSGGQEPFPCFEEQNSFLGPQFLNRLFSKVHRSWFITRCMAPRTVNTVGWIRSLTLPILTMRATYSAGCILLLCVSKPLKAETVHWLGNLWSYRDSFVPDMNIARQCQHFESKENSAKRDCFAIPFSIYPVDSWNSLIGKGGLALLCLSFHPESP